MPLDRVSECAEIDRVLAAAAQGMSEDGSGQISFDLPTDQMAVFGQSDLDHVGAGSSKTLAALLTRLGLPVPAEMS